MIQLKKVKEKWELESINKNTTPTTEELEGFKFENNLYIPDDLEEYFKQLNGTGGEYTDDLYEFYPVNKIKQVKNELINWKGVPNYHKLLGIEEVVDLYVFANYSFNLFVYAIRLGSKKSPKNEVYILCGEKYKKIADTFSEFLDLYLEDSIELQFS
ncbi:SMI1/KNR4 family protein [Dyadobacter sp. CY261]|uniref:SMI1/KNR4 family protein n=1 Tax=Dyadobacter sp. CY261 TaxID=2907203 RepID=UPI001F1D0004|nr:SMI1/KNR4 family protein [Dyadobacter sp. CY261]MCF0075689.1 SMI1/KNR4 family protein [Dyadobacter sp. CY261]